MAAVFGYLVYIVRANEPHLPRYLRRLSDLEAGDTLQLATRALESMGLGYHRDFWSSDGFRIKEIGRTGRAVFVKINKGPEGATGEAFDTQTGESVETTETQALLSGLRAMLVMPLDCYYGLLFVERVSGRHLKSLLSEIFVKPGVRQGGGVPRIESFAQARDWRVLLADHQVLRVSELLAGGSDVDASTPNDSRVKVEASGGFVSDARAKVADAFAGRAERRQRRLAQEVVVADEEDKRRHAEGPGVTLMDDDEFQAELRKLDALSDPEQDELDLAELIAEAVPVGRQGLKHEQYTVATRGPTGGERTFVIESNAIPQFVYELGGRLTDGGLRQTWLAHAEEMLQALGVTLSPGWADN